MNNHVQNLLDEAAQFFGEGDYSNALERYEEVLKIEPDNVEALIGKAETSFFLEKYEDVVDAYNKIPESHEAYTDANHNKGHALIKLGKTEDAIKACEDAIKKDANFSPAWLMKGVLLEDIKRYDDAINAFEKVISINKENVPEAWYNLGHVLTQNGKYKDALTALNKAIEIKPDYAVAYANKGSVFLHLKDYQASIDVGLEALKLNPNLEEVWGNLGLAYLYLNENQKALESYEKALSFNPNVVESWNNKGVALERIGRLDDALEAYEKTIELNPEYSRVWNLKGGVLYALGRYDEALDALQHALDKEPESEEYLSNKALLLNKLNQNDEALRILETVTIQNPEYSIGWYNKGLVLFNIGKYEKALQAYDVALKLDPKFAQAWNNKGASLFNLKRFTEALAAYKKSDDLNPESIIVNLNLAEINIKFGDLEKALDNITKVIGLDENNAHAWAMRGKIYIENNDYTGASKCFRKAVSFNEDDAYRSLYLIWDSYAKYLELEYSTDTKNEKYEENMISIIRTLERAEKLSDTKGQDRSNGPTTIYEIIEHRTDERIEIVAYILYFLGYLYLKSNDLFTAKEKLKKCVKLESIIRPAANGLLSYIWEYKIKPPFWRWWLFSPLFLWTKRIVFVIVLVSIFALFFLHPLVSSILKTWCYSTNLFCSPIGINWTVYTIIMIFLISILLMPGIQRVRAKDIVEMEFNTPPFEPSSFSAKFGEIIGRIEELVTIEGAIKTVSAKNTIEKN